MTYIEKLQDAIRQQHGCASTHLNSHPMTEKIRDVVVWDGIVEVFRLENHPKYNMCYAWSHSEDKDKTRFFVVLHAPPVDSPRKAVQAAIVSQVKSAR